MNTLINNNLRIAGLITGILLLALTLGCVFQLPWAVNLWPWPDSRLSYLFLGSILAAVTVAVGWLMPETIAVSGRRSFWCGKPRRRSGYRVDEAMEVGVEYSAVELGRGQSSF